MAGLDPAYLYMGVYIPNMEKSQNCLGCLVDEKHCNLWEDFDKWEVDTHPNCPLIEIPAGTCRLVEEFYPGELKAKQPVGSFILYRSADEDDGRFILKVED